MRAVLTESIRTDGLRQEEGMFDGLKLTLPSGLGGTEFVDVEGTRTDFPCVEAFREGAKAKRFRNMAIRSLGAAAMAIMVSPGRAATENQCSLPAIGQEVIQNLQRLSVSRSEYPVADFYEPVSFTWTKSADRIRQAAREYSERAHADH